MSQQWYIIHVYSGFESRVKRTLEESIKRAGKEDLVSDIMVPSEKVVEMLKGEKKTTSRKFFPGYILVRMELNNETWHLVKNIPKVSGFVGGGKFPPPLSDTEVNEIKRQMEEGAVRPKPKVVFEKGETIRVIDGPFNSFAGIVDDVKPAKGKLKVLVSIFGRSTSVELDFGQVEKM